MTKRWWIPNAHPSRAVVRRAFDWLDAVTPPMEPAGLVVATQTALRGGDIAHVLGDQAISLLTSKRTFQLPSGGRLESISMRGHRGGLRFHGPVLLVYADKKHLDFADQLEGVTEILVVPWQHSDVAYWVAQWNAVVLGGTPNADASSGGDLDPVVRVALESIFDVVIATEGRLRTKDRPPVIGLLARLRASGVAFGPEQIRIWVATRDGGNPRLADDIAAVAQDVNAGRNLELGKAWGLRPEAVARWRAKVNATK